MARFNFINNLITLCQPPSRVLSMSVVLISFQNTRHSWSEILSFQNTSFGGPFFLNRCVCIDAAISLFYLHTKN